MAKKAKENKGPEFEGMVLTPWQRFSTRLLGGLYKSKLREDEEMLKLLAQAEIRVMPEVYKSTQITSTAAVMVGCAAALFVTFTIAIPLYESFQDPLTIPLCQDWAYWHEGDVNEGLVGNGCPLYSTQVFNPSWKIAIGAVVGVFIPRMAFKHFGSAAERIRKERADRLEKFLPYAASYTAAMAAANATPVNIFRSLAMNGDIYGDIAYDSSMIYRDITLLGMDLITAVKHAVNRAASPWVTEFFQGMVGTLSSGGNLKLYFLNRAEHYMRENRIRLSVFLETLAMFAETYIVVAVAMPLFLIVMLVIMFWVSGAGSQISEGMVYGIVMGLLPMIHLAYSYIVWSMSQEQDM